MPRPGSTGAAVTAGLLGIGRIKGIERPAIVTPIPNEKGGHTFLIDSGASANAKAKNLLQNALLGYNYAKRVRHIAEPKVGLLNIGAESTKGSTEATLILGMVYMAQGDTSNARSFYQQYIDADGDDPAKGYNGLALCDISDGDYDSALQNISQGLGDATSDEMRDLLFNEIVVYEKKLDFSTALSKAQEYVQTFKDDDAAAKELTFLQSRVGNQAAAGDASEADTSNESTAEESADTGTDESSEESY